MCEHCDDSGVKPASQQKPQKPQKRKVRISRKVRDSIMRDLGLVRVRGALGGVYYE